LRDIIRTKDACGQIENCQYDRDHSECECRNERDYDLHGPYYDQPARCHFLARGQNARGIKPFSHDLRKVVWPPNFKPSTIDKYDVSTSPIKWFEVYQLAIEATRGDSYIMANYLPICLSSLAMTWLMGPSTMSVRSRPDLCW
jgi:hypothetical protein